MHNQDDSRSERFGRERNPVENRGTPTFPTKSPGYDVGTRASEASSQAGPRRHLCRRSQAAAIGDGLIAEIDTDDGVKEIGTLSSIWNRWAMPLAVVNRPAPTKGLLYAKGRAKPPFQTREQIHRQVARGGLSGLEAKELWSSLFLTLVQVQELLASVKARAGWPWVEVAFSFAAYTGARRSEILRPRVDDVDFEAGAITIREKKRDRTRQMTFRTVPMSAGLRHVMQAWLEEQHPGGSYTICGQGGCPLTRQTMTKAFRAAVHGSPWQVVQGYHVLRHSFASNCAMKGVDQRVIDSWMGHQTEAMRRRYRHLFPEQEQMAMPSVTSPSRRPFIHRLALATRCDDVRNARFSGGNVSVYAQTCCSGIGLALPMLLPFCYQFVAHLTRSDRRRSLCLQASATAPVARTLTPPAQQRAGRHAFIEGRGSGFLDTRPPLPPPSINILDPAISERPRAAAGAEFAAIQNRPPKKSAIVSTETVVTIKEASSQCSAPTARLSSPVPGIGAE